MARESHASHPGHRDGSAAANDWSRILFFDVDRAAAAVNQAPLPVSQSWRFFCAFPVQTFASGPAPFVVRVLLLCSSPGADPTDAFGGRQLATCPPRLCADSQLTAFDGRDAASLADRDAARAALVAYAARRFHAAAAPPNAASSPALLISGDAHLQRLLCLALHAVMRTASLSRS